MSNVTNKVAYLKGLLDGLNPEGAEAKLFAAIVDALQEIAETVEENTEAIEGLDEAIDEIADEFDEVEDCMD